MVSAIGGQTLFPIKSLLVIPCADNIEKEMVFSARVAAKCPWVWRSIEDMSEPKPSLDACLLACFHPPPLKEERFVKMGHKFQANVTR